MVFSYPKFLILNRSMDSANGRVTERTVYRIALSGATSSNNLKMHMRRSKAGMLNIITDIISIRYEKPTAAMVSIVDPDIIASAIKKQETNKNKLTIILRDSMIFPQFFELCVFRSSVSSVSLPMRRQLTKGSQA